MNPTHQLLSDSDHAMRGHAWSKTGTPRLNVHLARFMDIAPPDTGERSGTPELVRADEIVAGTDFP